MNGNSGSSQIISCRGVDLSSFSLFQGLFCPLEQAVVSRHLFVTVFMGLQRLHDGQLCVVLEARRLTAHDLLQDAQRQRSDGVLRTQTSSGHMLHLYCIHTCDEDECLTSLSPSVSSSSSSMVLKCSSHTARLSSRVTFSSSSRAARLSSTRSL